MHSEEMEEDPTTVTSLSAPSESKVRTQWLRSEQQVVGETYKLSEKYRRIQDFVKENRNTKIPQNMNLIEPVEDIIDKLNKMQFEEENEIKSKDNLVTIIELTSMVKKVVDRKSRVEATIVLSTFVENILRGSPDEDHDSKIEKLAEECVKVVRISPDDIAKKVGLKIALRISARSNEIANRVIWKDLLKPLIEMVTNTSPVYIKLCDVFTASHIIGHLANLQDRRIFGLQHSFNSLFSIYAALIQRLKNPVCQEKIWKLLLHSTESLSKILGDLIKNMHKVGHPRKLSVATYCLNMVMNLSQKTEDLCPLFVDLVGFEPEDSIAYGFQRVPMETMTKNEIACRYCTLTSALFQLLMVNNDSMPDTIKTLFGELLLVDSTVDLNDHELLTKINEKNDSNVNEGMKPKFYLEFFPDLQPVTLESVKRLVSTALLGEFSTQDKFLDAFIDEIGAQGGTFTYVMVLVGRLNKEMDIYSTKNKNEDFAFHDTLHYVIELILSISTYTYEAEKNIKKGIASTEDPYLKNLCGWSRLNQLIPFLTRVVNQLGPHLGAYGIDGKCEQIISFINTKGKGDKGQAEPDDEAQFTNCLFDINSAVPACKGAGLIRLKYFIHMRHPVIWSQIDSLVTLLETVLLDDDEYVFINCIKCLVSLAVEHHAKLIPRLIDLYAFVEKMGLDGKVLENDDELKYRLKIGEILTRTLTSISPIVMKYGNGILNAAFAISHYKNHLDLRVSSYQVVEGLVAHLGFALEEYLPRISHWAFTNLSSDQELLVTNSIWILLNKIMNSIEQQVSMNAVVPPNHSIFVKDVFRLSSIPTDANEGESVFYLRNSLLLKSEEFIKSVLRATGSHGQVTLHDNMPPI